MSLVVNVSIIAATLLAAVAVRWTDPETTAQLSRQTGVSGWIGWGAVVIGTLWLYLPIFAGASTDDGIQFVGSLALAVGGVGCCAVALSSVDEYRLLAATEHTPPASVSVGAERSVVATTGRPTVADEDSVTTIHGSRSVYTDWIVQRRGRTGGRRNWKTVAGGVDQTPFTLGDGAVSVDGDPCRVFRMTAEQVSFDPDEPLPERVAEFFEDHPALPEPAARRKRFKIVESYIPDGEPVTVVGTPRQGPDPGTAQIDAAPPNRVGRLGSSATESPPRGAPLVFGGGFDEAKKRITRRVYWLGIGGVILAGGGQILAFWFSSASLAAVV